MDIFNKIGKKASETYKVTAEKTGKLAKEAKLRIKMNENKSEIEGLYKQIGKKVYEKHVTDESINIMELLEEEVTKIDVLSDEIENILAEIMTLKDAKKCPNCFEKIEKDAKYCPKCGAEQVVEETGEDVEGEAKEAATEVANTVETVDSTETVAEEEPAREVEIVDTKNEDD